MTTDSSINCRWCGKVHGARCPDVKAIEYNADGTVKRVEFLAPNDFALASSIDWGWWEPKRGLGNDPNRFRTTC